MAHLEGIAHWLKYEFDVDVLLTSDLARALERLRLAEDHAVSSSCAELGDFEGGLPRFDEVCLVSYVE